MNAKDWKDSVRNAYVSLRDFRRMGFRKIEISGGDPLEFGGLPEFILEARRLGFNWVRVSTNGVRLAEKKFSLRLQKSGVDAFRIPLYGPSGKVHDSVTRSAGSFDLVLKGVRNIKKGPSKLFLTSLLLRQTKHVLAGTFDLMHRLECDDLVFAPVFVSNDDYSYYIPHKYQGHYFRKLLKHAVRTGMPLRFRDLPYCVLGFDNDFTDNRHGPAFLGKHFQPVAGQRTSRPDLPRYRRKIKVKICANCPASSRCDGFLVNDILKFGIGKLKRVQTGRQLKLKTFAGDAGPLFGKLG